MDAAPAPAAAPTAAAPTAAVAPAPRPTKMAPALAAVNEYLSCALCSGYIVDATTVTECLHTFCRSCIINYIVKGAHNACPVCDTVIHETKPLSGLKWDNALQDIVYRLVPNLYTVEMLKRQRFYKNEKLTEMCHLSNEQKGDIFRGYSDRIIFNGHDKICFSLDFYVDRKFLQDKPELYIQDLVENLPQRRYFRCDSAVTIGHIKKLLRCKYGMQQNVYIDLMHNGESLCDNYSFVDICYIYSWTKMEPLRLHYTMYQYTENKLACQTTPSSSLAAPSTTATATIVTTPISHIATPNTDFSPKVSGIHETSPLAPRHTIIPPKARKRQGPGRPRRPHTTFNPIETKALLGACKINKKKSDDISNEIISEVKNQMAENSSTDLTTLKRSEVVVDTPCPEIKKAKLDQSSRLGKEPLVVNRFTKKKMMAKKAAAELTVVEKPSKTLLDQVPIVDVASNTCEQRVFEPSSTVATLASTNKTSLESPSTTIVASPIASTYPPLSHQTTLVLAPTQENVSVIADPIQVAGCIPQYQNQTEPKQLSNIVAGETWPAIYTIMLTPQVMPSDLTSQTAEVQQLLNSSTYPQPALATMLPQVPVNSEPKSSVVTSVAKSCTESGLQHTLENASCGLEAVNTEICAVTNMDKTELETKDNGSSTSKINAGAGSSKALLDTHAVQHVQSCTSAILQNTDVAPLNVGLTDPAPKQSKSKEILSTYLKKKEMNTHMQNTSRDKLQRTITSTVSTSSTSTKNVSVVNEASKISQPPIIKSHSPPKISLAPVSSKTVQPMTSRKPSSAGPDTKLLVSGSIPSSHSIQNPSLAKTPNSSINNTIQTVSSNAAPTITCTTVSTSDSTANNELNSKLCKVKHEDIPQNKAESACLGDISQHATSSNDKITADITKYISTSSRLLASGKDEAKVNFPVTPVIGPKRSSPNSDKFTVRNILKDTFDQPHCSTSIAPRVSFTSTYGEQNNSSVQEKNSMLSEVIQPITQITHDKSKPEKRVKSNNTMSETVNNNLSVEVKNTPNVSESEIYNHAKNVTHVTEVVKSNQIKDTTHKSEVNELSAKIKDATRISEVVMNDCYDKSIAKRMKPSVPEHEGRLDCDDNSKSRKFFSDRPTHCLDYTKTNYVIKANSAVSTQNKKPSLRLKLSSVKIKKPSSKKSQTNIQLNAKDLKQPKQEKEFSYQFNSQQETKNINAFQNVKKLPSGTSKPSIATLPGNIPNAVNESTKFVSSASPLPILKIPQPRFSFPMLHQQSLQSHIYPITDLIKPIAAHAGSFIVPSAPLPVPSMENCPVQLQPENLSMKKDICAPANSVSPTTIPSVPMPEQKVCPVITVSSPEAIRNDPKESRDSSPETAFEKRIKLSPVPVVDVKRENNKAAGASPVHKKRSLQNTIEKLQQKLVSDGKLQESEVSNRSLPVSSSNVSLPPTPDPTMNTPTTSMNGNGNNSNKCNSAVKAQSSDKYGTDKNSNWKGSQKSPPIRLKINSAARTSTLLS